MFAEVFGIRPWEWDLLSVSDIDHLTAYLRERRQREVDGG